MVKKLLISTVLFILILFLVSGYTLMNLVATNTHTSLFYFPQTLYHSLTHPTLAPDFNFIILGIDPRDDQLEKTQVSDTLIIGRLRPNWQVNLVSLPRDLWYYPISAKINQIYPQSLEQSDQYGYIASTFSQLTGQKITKTIIVSTTNLIDLTNLLGGVDVELKSDYIDRFYPNPDYILHPNSRLPQYKTIKFTKGTNHLTSENITEFVRSRKGQYTDGSGGSDIDRINRQQILLNALLDKIKSPSYLNHPTNLFSLYRYWHESINTNLTDEDLFSLLIAGRQQVLQTKLVSSTIPIGINAKTGPIYHPDKFPAGQWVFLPSDPDYLQLHQAITSALEK